MTEEIGLIVRAKIRGDPGGMDRLKNDVGKSVGEGSKKGLADFKLPGSLGKMQTTLQGITGGFGTDKGKSASEETTKGFKADADGILSSIQSIMPGMGGSGGGAAAGGADGGMGGAAMAGGVAGVAAGVVVQGIQSIVSILEKMFNFLVQSSPQLQMAIKMITKAIMLFLMPIGNTIAAMLRPLYKSLMKASIANLQSTGKYGDDMGGLTATIAESLSSMLESMVPIFVEVLVQVIPAVVAGIGLALIKMWMDLQIWIVKGLWDGLSGLAGWIWNALTGALGGIPGALSGFATWVWNSITGALGAIPGLLGGFAQWVWDSLVSALQAIPGLLGGFASWLWASITNALGAIPGMLGGFATWVWNSITGALAAIPGMLGGLAQWAWDTITGALGTIPGLLGGFATWLWDSITGLISSSLSTIGDLGSFLYNTVSGIFSSIVSAVGNIGNMAYKTLYNILAGIPNSVKDLSINVLGQNIKPFEWVPAVAYLAEGGIVTQATNAVIGEAGPEAVIPLSKLGSFGGSQSVTNNFSIVIRGNVNGVEDIEREFKTMLRRAGIESNFR